MKKAVIVLPTYNENGNIENLIKSIFAASESEKNWEIHILVVDSQSTDNTADTVIRLQKKFPNIHLLETKKEGLGRAYIQGFQHAFDTINPYLLFEMDADLSHDPLNIPQFLRQIEKGADFVIGSRYMKGGSIPQDWGIHRKIFSFFGNLVVKVGFMKLKITDWTDGYRAIKAWVIRDAMHHIKNYSGYVFQIALLDYALKKKANVIEIPIHFKERKYGKSKINSVEYITNIIFYVLSHSSFIKFIIVGTIGFIIDFGVSAFLVKTAQMTIFLGNLISMEIAIVSNFLFNNFWSFSHKKIKHSVPSYVWSFTKFNITSIGSIIIQLLGITALSLIFGDASWQIYKVLVISFLVIPYSYIFYNKFVWKDK
jgi:dolichol-phosphate mannosyltransferase